MISRRYLKSYTWTSKIDVFPNFWKCTAIYIFEGYIGTIASLKFRYKKNNYNILHLN